MLHVFSPPVNHLTFKKKVRTNICMCVFVWNFDFWNNLVWITSDAQNSHSSICLQPSHMSQQEVLI